jgi:hypothetical protein
VRDGVLRAAAHASPPDRAVELIERMAGGRTAVAAEVAGRAAPTERECLLALAERHADDGALDERIDGLAALVAASHRIDAGRAARAAARLRAAVAEPDTANRAVLRAAETVHDADPVLGEELLQRVASTDSVASWERIDVVRLWAAWGRTDRSRALADRVLETERPRGSYGPVAPIAGLAGALVGIDPEWAHRLADEAERVATAAATTNEDPFETTRLDLALGQAVEAFRTWAPARALRIARYLGGGWISGSPWNSCLGRPSALACLGLDAAETDPELARRLLDECLRAQDPTPRSRGAGCSGPPTRSCPPTRRGRG